MGKLNYIKSDWPSYNEPGMVLRVRIKPEKRRNRVEFSFIKQR